MELTVIQTKIYEIRGQKVMLDFDLAEMYQVNTKRLNESVKRNSEKFPEDFMFRLSIEERSANWSQIATSSEKAGKVTSSPPLTSSKKHRGKVYLPYAFTEHGVTMLASVLKSECAVKMNIAIVRAFIAMRQIALQHKGLSEKLEELRIEMHTRLGEHDEQLNAIYTAIENLLEDKAEKNSWEERERIGFKK